MEITTDYLRKNVCGTWCGNSDDNENCLSNTNVIKFINDFFGGVLVVDEFYENKFSEGTASFIKKKISIDELKYWGNILDEDFYLSDPDTMDDLSIEDILIKYDDLSDYEHKNIIAGILSSLVGLYGGSIRTEINSYGELFIESE
jgi:hypothetical protein